MGDVFTSPDLHLPAFPRIGIERLGRRRSSDRAWTERDNKSRDACRRWWRRLPRRALRVIRHQLLLVNSPGLGQRAGDGGLWRALGLSLRGARDWKCQPFSTRRASLISLVISYA